ncbi:hypothetical protein ETB97_006073 [Aspergillus alliaceus]|uniref:Uncharacterized protein n=1 Tax=Petromyces alliaceus TaxID=209559 RepID=A0A5N7CFN1_PETAA|nr:uncharacterized protein BDW43DRAFT_321175 [Aspergillus alliaceus]KAB8238051.1 hypothetical protein BDW43DRAFT_321175 [Aspergillus alliaceus]KAE8392991.1 hypothetical protein BDV23DRAFT_150269 [Aspergillus alliaceus]KAF5864847.1 hypothetical protein ETB97_006073 [Aspergillus burnettii]
MVFARANLLRASARAVRAASRRPTQQFARRTYASESSHGVQKSSDLPWALASIGLGVPAAYYLISSGPEKKPHGAHGDHHEAVVETEKKEEKAPAGESEPQPDRDAEQKVDTEAPSSSSGEKGGSFEEPPSNVDEPASRGDAGGSATISGKQEGLSNTDTSNPYVNEPGKSEKGEGETETAKVKGTVDPERPQA